MFYTINISRPLFIFVFLLFHANTIFSIDTSPLLPQIDVKSCLSQPFEKKKAKRGKSHIQPPLFIPHVLILIDPGHGGRDTGTQSILKPRYQEKSLNLTTARFAKQYLQELGYQVCMTRETDRFVSLEKRAKVANTKKPILFVSIHYNSAPSAKAQGIEVFFYESRENKDRTEQSKRLAQAVLKNVLAKTKAKSRGVKQGNYAVIRETQMPAVLIEGGFLTNEEELQKLKDPLYLKRLAWGIVCGIEEYLSR